MEDAKTTTRLMIIRLTRLMDAIARGLARHSLVRAGVAVTETTRNMKNMRNITK